MNPIASNPSLIAIWRGWWILVTTGASRAAHAHCDCMLQEQSVGMRVAYYDYFPQIVTVQFRAQKTLYCP